MKEKLNCLLFFALCLCLSSCFTLKEPTVKGIENFKMGELSKDMNLKFDVRLQNPNSYAVNLCSMQMNLFMGDSLISKLSMDKKTKIVANGDVAIPFTVHPEMAKIQKLGWGMLTELFGKSNSKIRVEGDLVISKFIFRKKYSFKVK